MTLSNSVYLQMMQSVKEKTIKREFEVKEEDVVNDDAFIGGTYDWWKRFEAKVLKGISDEEVYKLQFDRIDEAETFYNMLARRDKNGDIISRKWVCSREGGSEPRSLTRVGCEVAFRVGLNRKDGKWIVKEFIGDHNHNLVDAINTQFLRSHRTISNPDKAQVDGLRKVARRFHTKDIYNHVDAMRRSEIKDGDAEAALAYLCGKAEMDSSFFYKFNIDEESRLANLFWADSTARMDYACFGDVLAFDTTYRTNAYKKPLVVLVGVNHHHQTVVFGCALLIDESVGTYEWVLETFLEAMMNKRPISVVTDGDKAMRKAIKKVLPDTCHRLCSWHLQRNAFTNVHIKDFSSIFARCMFMRGNEEEFEKVWHEMVANLGLNENRWVTEIYGKRKRWAEAYLRGNFFGGMRTTQRCESMNAYLNRFLKIRLRLYEFVQQFDRAILRIRQNEAKAEFESNNSSPVLSTKLAILENHAATVYTKESFLKFREEMKNAELFFVVGVVSDHSMRAYTLSKFRHPNLNWEVQFCPDIVTLKCSCMMFESIGIPCCHMVVVMKVEHLEEIPQSCIMKRWTKLAKVYTRSTVRCATSSPTLHRSSSSFIEARNEIQKLTARMEELYNYNLKGKKIASDGATGTNQVRDPNIVKTKGNPGKVAMNVQKGRRCSRCKREETNLSSQGDIQREMMPSTNSSVDIFATLHGMLGEQLPNDPSDMYIDWGELNNIAGVQQHEQSMSTPCEGGDPNKYPNEKDMQPFFYSLAE
ncbi:hypothetical protein AAG906_022386 [Vitis piasezkii]